MELKCKKDMDLFSKRALTKGKIYQAFESNPKNPEESHRPVLRIINDFNEGHIIKYLDSKEIDDFFEEYFEEV